ncbi:MAG: MFS transporter, partial [Actinomycetota bacterium]|nr:MFS transporter [Actinomycetota bacterium]
MANYPSDSDGGQRQRKPMPSANRYLPPLHETTEAPRRQRPSDDPGTADRVTVTRAAAARSREMGSRMYGLV